MKKNSICNFAICLIFCLLLVGCRQNADASEDPDPSFRKSAWTATKVSLNSDDNYEDVVSNDYALALFIDAEKLTVVRYNEAFTSPGYKETPDGFTAVEGTDMPYDAIVDDDFMYFKMLGITWFLEKTDIEDALSYARSLVGPDYQTLPFENDDSATDPSEVIESIMPESSYTTLVDDDICTIRSAGAFTIPIYIVPEPEEAAVFLLSITNRYDQTINLYSGDNTGILGSFSYGTINGQTIPAVVAADAHSSSPYFLDTLVNKPIAPGETIEFYLCPCPEMHYPTIDELINVSVNFYVSIQTDSEGYEHDFYNYTLPLS